MKLFICSGSRLAAAPLEDDVELDGYAKAFGRGLACI